jgi:hypothetical protein
MKRWVVGLGLLFTACGTASSGRGAAAAPAALVHSGQPAELGPATPGVDAPYVFEGVEVFGAHSVAPERVLGAFTLPAPGSPLEPQHKEDFIARLIESKQRLLAVAPWLACGVTVTELDTHQTFVTAELVEPGDAWRMPFFAAPTGEVADPEGLLAAWTDYQRRFWALRRQGAVPEFGEGTCRAQVCHGGFAHPELAPLEPRFTEGVPRQAEALLRVLREDKDSNKRYTALLMLPYVSSPEWLRDAALPAVRDPDRGVRNEALRLLGELQREQPRVFIPLDPVLEAVWYPTTSDRNKAGWALVALLQVEGAARRAHILERSGEALLQMFQMKNRLDHEPAHDVLALLAGEDLGEDVAPWRAWVRRVSADPR